MRLRAVAVAVVLALPASAAARPFRAAAPVTVSGPVPELAACHLNGDDNSPLLAADPRGGKRLELTYLTGDDRAAVAASSSDAGRTWARRAIPGLTACTHGPDGALVDPGLAIAPDGSVNVSAGWVQSGLSATAVNHDAIREYTSSADMVGGAFGAPVDVEPTQPDQRGYLLADGDRILIQTERVPYLGLLAPGPTGGYTFLGGSVALLTSSDRGHSWSLPPTGPPQSLVTHSGLASGLLHTATSLVAIRGDVDLPAAVVSLVTGQAIQAGLFASSSTDGGATWAPESQLASCEVSCVLPGTASTSGSVLVAYADVKPDGTENVVVARSTDDAGTWIPHVVAQFVPLPDPALSRVAVAVRGDGTIGVLYLAGVSGSGRPYEARLATSRDNGETWTSIKLAGPMSFDSITYPHFDGQIGPNHGLLATKEGFLAAFTVEKPMALVDGAQDVVVVEATDRVAKKKARKPKRRASRKRRHRHRR